MCCLFSMIYEAEKLLDIPSVSPLKGISYGGISKIVPLFS